jgi:hypothetical protein
MKRLAFIFAASMLFGVVPVAHATSSCGNKLCVPGDFPSPDGAYFNMNLLSGHVYVDVPSDVPGESYGFGDIAGVNGTLNNLQPIQFHASPFSNPSGTSVGTSTLTYSTLSRYSLGSFLFLGRNMEFYLEGLGTGLLTDIDGIKGDWSMAIPLRAQLGRSQIFDFGTVLLSTAATYSYYPSIDEFVVGSVSGQSMDYATGDAFLVGQATSTNGLRVTIGMHGNDPVVSSVPEPSKFWYLLAGVSLLGLMVRNCDHSPRLMHS